ncbi:MAG: L-threonylcarbamoyladenylate synthase [Verrucomicrobiota bacterium]|nr:L-threonylcarbamoyladenylate synthase [Verrucomicrobiota bacterium]
MIAELISPLDSARAVALLREGEVVALPTETVYGLAADATRVDAVVKIFEAKQRPLFDPLIVHLPTRDWLARVAEKPGSLASSMIEKFWPGPLTIVLPRTSLIPDIVTSGLPTVAVRMSVHPVFRSIIEEFAKPLAAPSANRFGRISPTTAHHVMSELAARIPLIVDGGPTELGVESTIVSVSGETITILRSGPITLEQLSDFGEVVFREAGETPDAPGRMKTHYAPQTRLAFSPIPAAPSQGLLGWEYDEDRAGEFARVEWLSKTGDLREAAATLFSKLRSLDESGLDLIVADPVPEHGLGIAIMDRLRKAAANG